MPKSTMSAPRGSSPGFQLMDMIELRCGKHDLPATLTARSAVRAEDTLIAHEMQVSVEEPSRSPTAHRFLRTTISASS